MGFLNLDSKPTFLPRLDVDVRAGRFFCVERVQNQDGDWENNKIEVEKPEFITDLGNCAIGYTAFVEGRPDSVLNHRLDGMPDRPSMDHNVSFELIVKMVGGDFDGTVRKFGKGGLTIGKAFNDLSTAFTEAKESADGKKCPIISVTGSVPIKTGKSTNYAPKWGISKWVKRPEEFDEHMPERIDLEKVAQQKLEEEKKLREGDLEFA